MMDKLQYDSFYKFIVSIGTLLIAVPILGIYYLFTGEYDILISEQEYLNLSQISLDALHSREKLMNVIFIVLPYVFFGLIAIGLFCVIWGGIKWYNIQKTLDEIVNLDADEKRYNYKKLTASEIAEKAVKEAIEIQDVTNTSNLSNQNQRIVKALQIENACFNYLEKKLSKKYSVYQNIKIKDYEYDVLAISNGQIDYDLIYEIKYFTDTEPITLILTKTIERLKKAGDNFKRAHKLRVYKLKIIIVTPDDKLESIKRVTKNWIENSNFDCSSIDIECISENELT